MVNVMLTDKMWGALGWTKSNSIGGSQRWYHNRYLGDDFIFYEEGMSMSSGKLSCDISRAPTDLETLYNLMMKAFEKAYFERGVMANQSSMRQALGIDD